jgi:hypothetical protein
MNNDSPQASPPQTKIAELLVQDGLLKKKTPPRTS